MNIQELGTLAQYGLPVKVVVLNNGWQGMVRQWQESFYEERYSASEMTGGMPDFERLAEAFGVRGVLITERGQLRSQLQEALDHPGPVFIDVKVRRNENCYPMVPRGPATPRWWGSPAIRSWRSTPPAPATPAVPSPPAPICSAPAAARSSERPLGCDPALPGGPLLVGTGGPHPGDGRGRAPRQRRGGAPGPHRHRAAGGRWQPQLCRGAGLHSGGGGAAGGGPVLAPQELPRRSRVNLRPLGQREGLLQAGCASWAAPTTSGLA